MGVEPMTRAVQSEHRTATEAVDLRLIFGLLAIHRKGENAIKIKLTLSLTYY